MSKLPPLELALQFAQQGIPVFPVDYTTKRPLTGEGGFRNASTDPETVKQLFRGKQRVRVGLVPGPAGYVVLDVDVKNGAKGGEELQAFCDKHELSAEFNKAAIVSTPSGGYHFWFKKRDLNEKVSNASPFKDIDIRADGGYVVAPGEDGYAWQGDTRLEDATVLPEQVRTAKGAESEYWKRGEKYLDRTQLNPENLAMLELLESIGGHNAWATDAEHNVLFIMRPGKTEENSASIGHINPGVVRVFTSNWKLDDGRVLGERYNVDELREFITQEQRKEDVTVNKVKTEDLGTMFRQALHNLDSIENIEPPEYLIDKYIVRDSIAELFADPGMGKSFLAIDWMMHIASGRDWCGHEVKKPEPVLYIIGEGKSGFGLRTKAWQQHYGKLEGTSRNNVHMLERPVNLADGKEVAAILPLIEELEPALIVIDTLARGSVGADGNGDRDMGIIVEHAEQMRRASGACVLILHHTGHQNKDRGRGSSALPGALTTDLRLSGDSASLKLDVTKQKDDEEAETFNLQLVQIELDDMIDKTSCVIVPIGTTVEKAVVSEKASWFTPKHKMAIEALWSITMEGEEETTSRWEAACADLGGPKKSQFYTIVKDLRQNGMIDVRKAGRTTYNKVLMQEPMKVVFKDE